MDTLQSALCLLVGIAMPLAFLFVVVRRGMRQFQVASAYGEVSRQLGLDVDTRGMSLQGHLGDRRIWIGEVMVGHGPERRMMTWGVLDLTRPLNLGLLVRRRGRTSRLLRRGSGPATTIGDADLDRVLDIQGDEPERIRALFTPPVRQALRSLMDAWPEVAVTDRAVRVHLSRPEASTERLQLLVSSMLGVAEALETSRRAVPVPQRLEGDLEGWTKLADRLGLDLEPWLPALAGELSGRRVLIGGRRLVHGYCGGLKLWFRAHHATGLRLRPQTEPDGYWSVGQDIHFADTAFDSAFVIKGWDPEAVRALLGDEARAALMQLASVGHTTVDDHCIDVEQIELDPDTLARTAAAATRLASALGW